ncbi:hypothetical protein PY254_15775 [Rhodanobacter sp. AS-Z3]|uniref:hypothetical protein n=1 Tax=Rhodanobacter sp. AS-Z3 TaxID=3031330 RepID=UPI002479DC76|nr:hypothetical protein [Rhodanobacter sp. AS-Z3]WEN14671.1 hypothetical protein PY254_15775 [Rhodanobacter sp. AS-Z3]
MAAQLVKPYRKSQHSKNHRNDAEAITAVARQGNMHFVPINTIDQQARLAWRRVREGYKAEALRRVLAELHEQAALPIEFTVLVHDLANKHARQLWVTLAQDVHYDPCASLRHPMRRSVQAA